MQSVQTTFLLAGFALVRAMAQSPVPVPDATNDPALPAPIIEPVAVAVPLNYDQRIAGVIPDYQTVRENIPKVLPLTTAQKWELGWRETVDPFNLATAFLTAGTSQAANQTPKYGEGWPAYGMRVGAAIADNGTQSIFSAGLIASALHQDPRYFRYGPEHHIAPRVVYSVSRLFICRQDSGKNAFNASNIFGMLLGIVASNAYYPAASRNGNVMLGRFLGTSMSGGVYGNLMSEFWPDVERFLPAMQRKLLGRKKDPTP